MMGDNWERRLLTERSRRQMCIKKNKSNLKIRLKRYSDNESI